MKSPQLKKRYRVISCVPVSKETLPSIRVSKLMPEGYGKCVKCGIEATHVITYTIANEDHRMVYANIFAGSKMMTADHILPRALGGNDARTNLQLMCTGCNGKKGCSITADELSRVMHNKSVHLRPNLTKGQVKNILTICPGVQKLFEDYFPDGPVIAPDKASKQSVPRPVKHAFKRPSGRPMKIKHPHHPLKGWIRIFDQFPELKHRVQFHSPHSLYWS